MLDNRVAWSREIRSAALQDTPCDVLCTILYALYTHERTRNFRLFSALLLCVPTHSRVSETETGGGGGGDVCVTMRVRMRAESKRTERKIKLIRLLSEFDGAHFRRIHTMPATTTTNRRASVWHSDASTFTTLGKSVDGRVHRARPGGIGRARARAYPTGRIQADRRVSCLPSCSNVFVFINAINANYGL